MNSRHSLQGIIAFANLFIKPPAAPMTLETLTEAQRLELLATIDHRYLQPEYLYMDGERSPAAGRKIEKELKATKAELIALKLNS